MASIVLYAVFALLAVFYYFYSKLIKKLNYFKDRGISQLENEFLYGSARDLIKKKLEMASFYRNVYNRFKKMGLKHGGIYMGFIPIWIPIEPDLIKTIVTKDFEYFTGHFAVPPLNTVFKNLFIMYGEEWKDMRRKLSPAFSSGKIKMMYNIILEKSYKLADLVGEKAKTGEATEIKGILARFTTDIIATSGFGVECDSLRDENVEFFRKGQKSVKTVNAAFQPSKIKALMTFLGIKPLFKPKSEIEEYENFFRNIVKQTIEYREANKVVKKDFMHLMIQLKNKGAITELTHENEDVFHKTVNHEVMTVDDIASQCMLFFNAGFETSSSTLSYALLELTQYPEIQRKLTVDVREVLKRFNGIISYEALQEMKYVDNVIHETLRKYPILSVVPRFCTKTYTIPGTDTTIEKGTQVMLPVVALQMDPDYFPDPEKFIPERFDAANKDQIREFTYMPFGEGPRMCLGLRLGVLQSKAGLAALMKDYNFTLDKKTPYPPNYTRGIRFLSAVDGGIWLHAKKVD